MDTKTMNEALLGKWGWRMLRASPEDQCYNLLKNKYLRRNSFLQCTGSAGSQFRKGILKTRDILKWGCKSEVNNGLNTRFWEDVWFGDTSLKIEFPTLYSVQTRKLWWGIAGKEMDGKWVFEDLWGIMTFVNGRD